MTIHRFTAQLFSEFSSRGLIKINNVRKRKSKDDSFEHWLVMYLLKYRFLIIFNQKKVTDCTLNKVRIISEKK